MRRPADRSVWRDDRLGSVVRSGLPAEWRDAAPSPDVWRRIAREVTPPPPRPRGLLGRRRPAPPGGASRGIGRNWLSSGAAMASAAVLLAAVLAVGNLFALDHAARGDTCRGYYAADCVWDDMTGWELAIQPSVPTDATGSIPGWVFRFPTYRIIDRAARARRLWAGYEAYNRADWLREPPPPTEGPVAVVPREIVVH